MDLRNNEITVKEMMLNPAAKKLVEQEFPEVANPLLLSFARHMTLASVLDLVKGQYPQEKIDHVINDLKAL